MGKYDHMAKKLLEAYSSTSQSSHVELVIIDLVKAEKIHSAIKLAKETKPQNNAFYAVFAAEILDVEELNTQDFTDMKEVAGEKIVEKEADMILGRYTDGVWKRLNRSVPDVILEASSKKAMIAFYKSVMADNAAGGWDYLKKYFPFLEQKI